MNTKLPGECAACGAAVSNSHGPDLGAALRQPTPKRRVVAVKSKPGRAVKLLLPLLTDWT